ncbi:pyruvate kinase [Phycisphaera mikurensis]|uniref:Pyruvate kinase n=1 Tax=Phycisphaera mikurensis (strain NBRC 102666 / KCTC 22515 / FYK2301M01) TaxID=1142394 RepID=I0IHH3_PHYMF|nr:pyruvate kinase [Phycisphaera mikurensis]MBB6440958.1 pyruvate kinase [Phycisphaera mikurensis]BAM04711.1 pyruvate kinase [Phycisphaera mikurensis NBRC 102666]
MSDLVLTKVLATLGPATADPTNVAKLIQEGVRVLRLNFSHGGFDEFARTLASAREGIAATKLPVGILGDLSGPKIRCRGVTGGSLELNPGDTVEFVAGDDDAVVVTPGRIRLGTTYDPIVTEVEPGHRVLINDGAIRMLATVRREASHPDGDGRPALLCRVTHGNLLSPSKGINLPDTEVSAPALTDWDRRCAAWAVENDLDFVALSFVRKAADVDELLDLLESLGRDNRTMNSRTRLPVIAKIEKPQAIEALDAILAASDGVMVARGDLGVEMDVAEVPVLQKQIVKHAHTMGRPVIVATQMLESMISAPTPTRAEVSDVANAILDGADATMLSGETAVGRFPVITVKTMARTARIAEGYLARSGLKPTQRPAPEGLRDHRAAAIARGVAAIVEELEPRYVVIWSETGGGARYLSHCRLRRPIIAFTSSPRAERQMTLLYGIHPVLVETPPGTESFIRTIDDTIVGRGWAEAGETVLVVKGEPIGTPGVTNKIRIHELRAPLA